MKSIKYLLVMFLAFLFFFNVRAMEYEEMQLIPVDTIATVHSENFDYNDFSYSSVINEKGNATINFGSIYNKSFDSMYVSINVLLFDEEKKNVGYLTYCTSKDKSSEYSDVKIGPKQTMPFKINVVATRYFVKEKMPKDVKFIAVKDDNKYCQIGGYTKYSGLTLESIKSGEINTEKTQAETLDEFYTFLQENGIIIIAIMLISVIVAFSIYGAILNALHRRMFGKSTSLAYWPITNAYITIKLAFGKIPATIYMIALVVSVPLSLIGIGIIIQSVLSIVSGLAFVLILIKLITKRYDLLYYEPKVKSTVTPNNQNNYQVSGNNQSSYYQVSGSVENSNQESNVGSKFGIAEASNQGNNLSSSENHNNSDDSLLDNNNTKEGESDLSKFFN